MAHSDQLLILDFDGVLCDSVGECCIVSARLLSRMYPEDNRPMPRTLEEVEPGLREHFFAHRLLIGPGADFETVVDAYRRGISVNTREELTDLVAQFDKECPRDPNAFYNERNLFRQDDMESWLALHTLYADVPERVAGLQQELPVFVVSNKDFLSLKLILAQQGIHIDDSAIFGKEVGLKKFPTIQKIAADQGRALNDIWYVDDHLGHLLEPHAAGVRCLHADWGYTTDADRQQAREENIRSLTLDEFGPAMLS
jgi:phosphoglycolate phosphatase-like HAD superfamily hydrolase